MRNQTGYVQIERFLDELDRALGNHPEADRAEIVGSVREHIQSALGDRSATPDEVNQVLRSLGDPLAIASEATAPSLPVDRPTEPPRRDWRTSRWIPNLALPLTAGSGFASFLLLPVIPLLIGLTLFWDSPLWKPIEKLVGTLAMTVPGVLVVALWKLVLDPGQVCTWSSGNPTASCSGGVPGWVSALTSATQISILAVGVVIMMVLIARGTRRAEAPHHWDHAVDVRREPAVTGQVRVCPDGTIRGPDYAGHRDRAPS